MSGTFPPGFMFGNVPPHDDEKPRKPEEHELVLSWREEQFRSMGFNDLQAVALAVSSADTHEARRLIQNGCDRLLVVDLLT